MKKPFYKKIWFWLVILLVIGGAGAASTKKKDKQEITSVETGSDTKISIDSGDSVNDQNKSTDPSIDSMLLFDEAGIKCTANGISNDTIMGYGVDISLESSADKNYTIQCKATTVNDYMIFDLFSCELAPGKKANDTIYLSSSELEAAGITNIGKIELYFVIIDSETFMREYELDPVTIKTSYYDQMDSSVDISGKTLYDENGIKIIGKYVNEDNFWGTGVCLYIENNTDKEMVITAEDVSVNGYMIDGHLYCDIYPGKKAVDEISFFSRDLENNGITSVDEVELNFQFMDSDYNISKTESIKFSTK